MKKPQQYPSFSFVQRYPKFPHYKGPPVFVSTTQIQTGVTNIKGHTTRTQLGVARIVLLTTTHTQTGKGNIRNSTTRLQSGLSNIRVHTSKTQTGLARLSAAGTVTTTKTITGKSNVRVHTTRTQSGVGHILPFGTNAYVSTAKLQIPPIYIQHTTRTQTGIASLVNSGGGNQFHVTTAGTSGGDGSIGNPWDLQTALNQPASVHAGDTIWIHAGTYNGTYTAKTNGTSSHPIVIRNWQHGRATIDQGTDPTASNILTIGATYTWFWGLEVMSSDGTKDISQYPVTSQYYAVDGQGVPNPSWPLPFILPRGEGIEIEQSGNSGLGCKFINCIVHDTRQGFSCWIQANPTEWNGCIVYDNGWTGPDRPHGHNFYIQNPQGGGTKTFKDNMIMRAYSHNIQSLGGQYNDNESFIGNVGINGGERNFLMGSDYTSANPVWQNNVMYYDTGLTASCNLFMAYPIGYTGGTSNASVTGNYFIQGVITFNLNTGMTFTGNTLWDYSFVNSDYTSTAGNTATNSPTGLSYVIRINAYESNRANLMVFNWNSATSINVDISSVISNGATYSIVDAQNYYGTPIVGPTTYGGGTVSVPLTGTSLPPIVGNDSRGCKHTSSVFNAFVIIGS